MTRDLAFRAGIDDLVFPASESPDLTFPAGRNLDIPAEEDEPEYQPDGGPEEDDDEYHPRLYFTNYAENARVSQNCQRKLVRVPEILYKWVDIASRDLLDGDIPKEDVASLAVAFGANRPQVDWDIPIHEFSDIAQDSIAAEFNGESLPGWALGPMDTSHTRELSDKKVWVRLEPQTREVLGELESVLRTRDTNVIRHCMSVSFVYYSEDVWAGRRWDQGKKGLLPYHDRLREELEARVDRADDHL